MKIEFSLSSNEATALERFAADFDFASPEAAGEAALRACLRGYGYLGAPTEHAEEADKLPSPRNILLARNPAAAKMAARRTC